MIWAKQVGDRLGKDANHWHTGFGPTNVELHRLSTALDLGDVGYVADHALTVRTDHLPAERGVTHGIDLARAFGLIARDDEALQHLLTAEWAAPQLVRRDPAVRETVKAMHRRAPVTSATRSSALLGLAERCRAIR